jgi:hypothetical protein
MWPKSSKREILYFEDEKRTYQDLENAESQIDVMEDNLRATRRSCSIRKPLGHESLRESLERISGLAQQSGIRMGSHLHPGTESVQPCVCAASDRAPTLRSRFQ